MAKAPAKSAASKAPAKKATASAKPKVKATALDIEKVTEDVLTRLRALDIEQSLQADMEWCLGSYRADKNPIGLFDMISRALPLLKVELQKKTKGVTPKLIGDIEKALAAK